MVLVVPKVGSFFKVTLNSTTRDLASTAKEAYNATVMTGKVHRLVYDLSEQNFWVEVGPADVLLDTAESKEKEERKKRQQKEKEGPPVSEFVLAKTISRKKVSLPRGVEFQDIVTEQSPEPIKEGLAYTHFFPHGISEQTLIHIKDNSEHQITLLISPVLARTRLYERRVEAKEAYETKSR